MSDAERDAIKHVMHALDPSAEVYLFGSRVSDEKKGGDIDLLVISSKISEKNKRQLKIQLYDAIGEQKIDLVLAKDLSEPFVRIAYEQGVRL